MNHKTIALGADHGGYEVKEKIAARLRQEGYRVVDMGTHGTEATDYPIYGFRVAEAVGRGQADCGVLVCRSGNGMAISANKVHGVRAALADTREIARLAREHNDANVIIIGADYAREPGEEIVQAFLNGKPETGRHARRVDLIRAYEKALASSLPTHELISCGQSAWLDDISDTIIKTGQLARLVEHEGVRGVTSNPTIFEKAINSGEGRYQADLAEMKKRGLDAEAAYEALTSEDIIAACDILRPLYDATGGDDGYVSYEELPSLALDEEGAAKEATRLFFEVVNRPNVMIKIPGTDEGIRAFRLAIAAGVNVNVTLIFSRDYYQRIARAYIAGLADRLRAGGDVTRVRSVASVFVSRIDTSVDKALTALRANEVDPDRIKLIDATLHQAAIANAKMIYQDFKDIFYGEEFAELAGAGAAPQRPLWASTGVKDPALRDTLYVEELVAPLTVNTIPGPTMKALLDHGRIQPNTAEHDLEGARKHLADLKELGIDLEKICADLQTAGVKSFADSFDTLFAAIKKQLA